MLYHCLQETEFYNKYLHETCPPPIQSSSSPDSSLRPVTLGLVQEEQEDTGATGGLKRPIKKKFDPRSGILHIVGDP